jgi:hypothetical protein
VAGGDAGREFMVAAAEIPGKCVTGSQDPRGLVALQSAHRPQPCFQPAVISLDRVVRIPLDGVQL